MLIPFLSDVCIEGAVRGRRQSLVGFLNCLVDLFLKVLPDESNEVAIAPVCDVGTIRLSYRVAGRINICRSNLRSRSALCHGMKRTWPEIATDSRSLVGSYQSSLVFIRNSHKSCAQFPYEFAMLQASLSNPIVTEKLGSVFLYQANQTGWTFRRVLGYYGTRKKDTPVFALLQGAC